MVLSIRGVLVTAFIFLIALCALGCNSNLPPDSSTKSVARVKPDVTIQPLDATATPSCTSGSATAVANCEFASLTHATDIWTGLSGHRPIWASWADKCDVGLLQNCAHPPGVCKTGPFDSHPRSLSDLLALAPAVQLLPENKGRLKLRPTLGLQELSSVLFSPEMCKEAKYLNNATNLKLEVRNGVTQRIPDPEVPPSNLTSNSTVVKLVWEIVVPGNNFYIPRVFDPTDSSAYGKPPQLIPLTSWTTQYNLDFAESSSCKSPLSKPGSGGTAPFISINCFYHYAIDMNNPLVLQVIRQNATNIPGQQVPSGAKGFVILVAAHVMTFHPDHPLWEWMTYYWTPYPTLDHSLWKSPWNHYAMSTMNAPISSKPTQPISVANPYLEGNIDPKGMSTNCVSCHSLASYNGSNSPTTRAALASDVITTSPHFPASETTAIKGGYFEDAIRTHFLWSFVNNPALY